MKDTYYLIKMLEVQYKINPTTQIKELIEHLVLKQIANNADAKLFVEEKRKEIERYNNFKKEAGTDLDDEDIPF